MILPGLRLIVIVVKKNLPWTLAITLFKLKIYQTFLSMEVTHSRSLHILLTKENKNIVHH